MTEAFAAAGVPAFADQNGAMMEGDGGCALTNLCVRDGRRQSVFRGLRYVSLTWTGRNLTVLTEALVTRLVLEGNKAVGVEFLRGGQMHRIGAEREVVLSLGAIHTPKLLMQSGIGDEFQLKRFDIPVVQHLPGVGRNFQDHFMSPCVWEANEPIIGRNNLAEATAIWKSNSALDTPDLQTIMTERLYASPQVLKSPPPPHLSGL